MVEPKIEDIKELMTFLLNLPVEQERISHDDLQKGLNWPKERFKPAWDYVDDRGKGFLQVYNGVGYCLAAKGIDFLMDLRKQDIEERRINQTTVSNKIVALTGIAIAFSTILQMFMFYDANRSIIQFSTLIAYIVIMLILTFVSILTIIELRNLYLKRGKNK